MFKRSFILSIITLLLVTNSTTQARELSLNDAIQLALLENEDIQKVTLNIQKMGELVKQIGASRWFRIDATFGYEADRINQENLAFVNNTMDPKGSLIPRTYKINNAFYNGSANIHLFQPLDTFGKIGASIKAAKYGVTMSKHQKKLIQRELRYATTLAYYSAILSDVMLEISKKSYKNALKSKKLIQGAAISRPIKSDLIRVSSDIALRKPEVDKDKYIKKESYRALKILCNLPENEAITLTSEFNKLFTDLNQDLLKGKLNHYPEFEILKSASDMYCSQAYAKKAEKYPDLVAYGGYTKAFKSRSANLSGSRNDNVAYIGINIKIPLWDHGMANAASRQKKIEAQKTEIDLSKRRKELQQQLNNAMEKHEIYLEVYKNQKKALNLANKSYQTSLSRFKVGKTSATELNDAEMRLTGAHKGLSIIIFELNTLKAKTQKLTEDVA